MPNQRRVYLPSYVYAVVAKNDLCESDLGKISNAVYEYTVQGAEPQEGFWDRYPEAKVVFDMLVESGVYADDL